MYIRDSQTGANYHTIFLINAETADNAFAYANMAVSMIPKSHTRKRAEIGCNAYVEYFVNNAEKLDKVVLKHFITSPEEYLPELTGDEPVEIIFTRKVNLGTRKWSDYRTIVTSVSGCEVYKVTADNLLYVNTYGEKLRTPIGNVIAIVLP